MAKRSKVATGNDNDNDNDHDQDMDAWELLKQSEKAEFRDGILERLSQLARKKNIAALNVLSMIHSEGLRDSRGKVVVAKNAQSALKYTRRAAALGDADSMSTLANYLVRSRRAPRSAFRDAEKLYRRAFQLGNETAAYNLGRAYANRGMYKAAVRWYRRADKGREPDAEFELARAELYGLGARRNVKTAFARLRSVASSKISYVPAHWLQTQAMLVMADALISGWPVPVDFAAGVGWLRRAARLGSDPAKALLRFHTGRDS